MAVYTRDPLPSMPALRPRTQHGEELLYSVAVSDLAIFASCLYAVVSIAIVRLYTHSTHIEAITGFCLPVFWLVGLASLNGVFRYSKYPSGLVKLLHQRMSYVAAVIGYPLLALAYIAIIHPDMLFSLWVPGGVFVALGSTIRAEGYRVVMVAVALLNIDCVCIYILWNAADIPHMFAGAVTGLVSSLTFMIVAVAVGAEEAKSRWNLRPIDVFHYTIAAAHIGFVFSLRLLGLQLKGG